jgi:hypothetical protein
LVINPPKPTRGLDVLSESLDTLLVLIPLLMLMV